MVTKVRGSVLADKNPYVVNDTSEIRSGSFPSVTFIKLKTRGNAEYQVDLTDTVSADDDFLVVIDGDGKRWKLVHNGTIDVRWAGAVGDGVTDDTVAIQKAMNAYATVHFQFATYKITGLTGSLFGQTLIGTGNRYAPATLLYTGTGTAITCAAAVNYCRIISGIQIKGVPTVGTDYYNTGSVGVDITAGSTSIEMSDSWVKGFETTVKSNFNSFYNKFLRNRFEETKTILSNFSANNLVVEGNRCQKFNQAVVINGNEGPTGIIKNSFEFFNGALVISTGNEYPNVSFKHNYVEDYYTEDLPTNFPASAAPNTTKFGGGNLFSGYAFDTLDIQDNTFQIASIFRITSTTLMRHYVSKNNTIRLAQAGNNLERLANFGTSELRHLEISDTYSTTGTVDAGFVRTYVQTSLPTVDQNDYHFFYDAISGLTRYRETNPVVLSLLNGWTDGTGAYGTPRAFKREDSVMLSGTIDGTSKTDVVFCTLPASCRPYEYGTTRAYADFSAFSGYGGGTVVRCRYLYATGDVRMELGAASYVNIPLDGIIIPPRH